MKPVQDKKTDRFIPVITMVLLRESQWDGSLASWACWISLKGMKAFVNDYRILLVEARENNLTFIM